jgi:hypothetical protein
MPNDRRSWLNADPTAGFWAYLREQGLNQLDPVSRFAFGQYQRAYNDFYADAADNPTLGFYDYLQGRNYNFRDEFARQSPEQRGDYSSRTHGVRARWVTPR